VPRGKCVLGVEFTKEKPPGHPQLAVPNQCVGSSALYINDEKAGALDEMVTQAGKFALCGEGLNIAGDAGALMSDDDPNGHRGPSPAGRSSG
jgi:hypothetical protein